MFSRYEVYTTVQSIYCYRETDVLRNKLNWGQTDRDTLLDAAVRSVDNSMAFCDVLKQCIEVEANLPK